MSAAFSVIGLLTSSTGAALFRKVLFQLKAPGIGGDVHPFEKPYFTAWESAVALMLCLPVFYIGLLFRKKKKLGSTDEEQPLLEDQGKMGATEENSKEADVGRAKFKQILSLSIPGLLNIASIIFQGIGLQYITATLMLMLTGSTIIFTAILAVLLLKSRLNRYHILGITLTLVGVGIVSVANIFSPPDESNELHAWLPPALFSATGFGSQKTSHAMSSKGATTFGVIIVLLSSLFMAGRLVAEELALEGTDLHPFQVLGYEGLWSTIYASLICYPLVWFLPGSDVGHRAENLVDSLIMLGDRNLSIINAVFFLSVIGINVFGLFVTSSLGSVFRAVLLTSRTASVWALNLLIFYAHLGGEHMGEPWRSPTSWIQLVGFALLLAGTIIYAQGSSRVALDLEDEKVDDATEPDGTHLRKQISAVTRVRPYTSLYIPNVPQRRPAAPLSIPAGSSLPSHAVWQHQRLPHHVTGSVPNNMNLAIGGHGGLGLRTPRIDEENPEYPVTPVSPGLSATPQGASPRELQGGSPMSQSSRSFFMQSLTARSSWVVDPKQGALRSPRVGSSTPVQPQEGSALTAALAAPISEYRDLSFDLPRNQRIGSAGSAGQLAGSAGSAQFQREGSFTFPHYTNEELQSSGHSLSGASTPALDAPGASPSGVQKPLLGQSPAPNLLLQYKQAAAKGPEKLPSFAEAAEEEDEEAAPAQDATSSEKSSGPKADLLDSANDVEMEKNLKDAEDKIQKETGLNGSRNADLTVALETDSQNPDAVKLKLQPTEDIPRASKSESAPSNTKTKNEEGSALNSEALQPSEGTASAKNEPSSNEQDSHILGSANSATDSFPHESGSEAATNDGLPANENSSTDAPVQIRLVTDSAGDGVRLELGGKSEELNTEDQSALPKSPFKQAVYKNGDLTASQPSVAAKDTSSDTKEEAERPDAIEESKLRAAESDGGAEERENSVPADSHAQSEPESDKDGVKEQQKRGSDVIERKASKGLTLTKSDKERLREALGYSRVFSEDIDESAPSPADSSKLADFGQQAGKQQASNEIGEFENPFAKSRNLAIPPKHSRKPSTDGGAGSQKSEAISILGSSGERSDSSRSHLGPKHVFGQSPTPEVLQQRKSLNKGDMRPLASLKEDETETDSEKEGEDTLRKPSSPELDGDLDSFQIVFGDDSESDVSLDFNSEISSRAFSTESPLYHQPSRSLHDVDPFSENDSPPRTSSGAPAALQNRKSTEGTSKGEKVKPEWEKRVNVIYKGK